MNITIRNRSSGLFMAVSFLLVSAGLGQTTNADNVVLRWNQAALDSMVATRTVPAIAARALAIVHTCIFDAWSAYDDTASGTQFGAGLRQPAPERNRQNKEKAISFAAYRALADLFPSQTVIRLVPLMNSLGYDPSDQSTDLTSSTGIGNVACQAVLDVRHGDGSNQLGDLHPSAYSDYTGYTSINRAGLLTDPNRWQPLIVNGTAQTWQLPHWGQVKPFALASGSQFRAKMLAYGPIVFPSAGYLEQANAVIRMSAQLGDMEKAIAEYWADGPTTVTPPGHWNQIAQFVSRRDHHSLDQDVKLFFILGNSLLDTSIATWDVKRYFDSVRPITVIRSEMGRRTVLAWAGPGLGTHAIDCKDFRSFLPTPPFGGYVSGHSSFSAAAAEILKRFSGSDDYGDSFVAAPGTSTIEPGLTPRVPLTLHWATFTMAADQAGISRRYGGIHFEADDLAGRQLGRLVAVEVWNKAIRYIDGSAP